MKAMTLKTVAALLMGLVSFNVHAQEVVVDNVTYYLYGDGTAEVTDFDIPSSGEIVIPAYVEYNEIKYKPTSIGFIFDKDVSSITSISTKKVLVK